MTDNDERLERLADRAQRELDALAGDGPASEPEAERATVLALHQIGAPPPHAEGTRRPTILRLLE